MNAPPFPINPGVGDWFQNWVWNGARWVASPTTGLRVLTRRFTESGPYMPSPGLVSVQVECIGGGGAGGGAQAVPPDPQTGGWFGGGGGGASGQYARSILPAALVRGGVMVTVGAGGTGGTANAQGTQGGTTSFGGLVVAPGGWPANPFHLGLPTGGFFGTGGWASTDIPGVGNVTSAGSNGDNGNALYYDPLYENGFVIGGTGGDSFLEGGGHGMIIQQATGGEDGQDGFDGTGGGGGGAVSSLSTAVQNGGNGGSGICIVTEYCWGDVNQPQPPAWRPPAGPWWPSPWPPGPWPAWPPGPPGFNPGQPPWPRGALPQGQEFEADMGPYSQEPEDP